MVPMLASNATSTHHYAVIDKFQDCVSGANVCLDINTGNFDKLCPPSGRCTDYAFQVRCQDSSTLEANTNDYSISFIIDASSLSSGPDPYTCIINNLSVENNIPKIFDVCVPVNP